MGNEMMDIEQLATYLHRDVRDVSKLASRGHLPGQKVAGQWRFARAEINQWIETQMPSYSDEQLSALEDRHAPEGDDELLVVTLLTEPCIAVPMRAGTRGSAQRELVRLAEQSTHVYDREALLEAIMQREELMTTALPNGVAIPHPRRPLPHSLGDSIMAFGRSASGIPFGAERGVLTDVFFLVCCRDEKTHLRVLARLSRLMLRPGFLDDLRAAETPAETLQFIESAERELLAT
jgi:PTS system nitrogen regulatory IIA component